METPNFNPIDDLPENDGPLPLDDFKIIDPEENDIQEEIDKLDGFREYLRESRGDSLTFGDY